MTDSQDIPLREWLRGEFQDVHRRIDEIRADYKGRMDYHERLLVGNGQPGLVTTSAQNREAIIRLDAGFASIAKEQRDARAVKRVGKWGGLAGGISAALYTISLVAALIAGQPVPRP